MLGMKCAVLTLVESKNPPVFQTPMVIYYGEQDAPRIGESFLFINERHGNCNTSEVKAIRFHSEQNVQQLVTLNSVYQIQAVEPAIK
jgi:hypothetical protein